MIKLKTIYSKTWQTEVNVCMDKSGLNAGAWYLMPTENTDFDIIQKFGFQKSVAGKWILPFDSPENYGLSWNDCIDADEINGIMALVFEKDGLLSVHPAFGGSGMAVDGLYMALGTYGNWGDYIRIDCTSCGKYWYHNQRHTPIGENNEINCPHCGATINLKH